MHRDVRRSVRRVQQLAQSLDSARTSRAPLIATEADPLGVLRSPHGTSGHPPVVGDLRREPLRTVRVARRRLRVLLIKVSNMIHRQRLRVSIEGDGEPVKKTDLAKNNR